MRYYLIGLALFGLAEALAGSPPTLTSQSRPGQPEEPEPTGIERPGVLGSTEENLVNDVRLFERVVQTRIKEQPEIRVILRLPEGHTASKPIAKGVLAFCTWQAEAESLRARLADDSGGLGRFADRHGLALMTWNTQALWKTGASHNQLSRAEKAAQEQRFDAIARAWMSGVREIFTEFQLPEEKILLYGISRGAHYALRLALRYPSNFLAVHVHVANSYEKPTQSAARTAWLVTSGDLDRGRDNAVAFYQEARARGVPALLKIQNGLGHAGSPAIDALRDAFFEFALAAEAGGKSPSDKLAEGLERPPFYGELLSQNVFPASDAKFLPEVQRVGLPSAEIARAWEGR